MATLFLALAAGCAPGPIGAEFGSDFNPIPAGGSFAMDSAYIAPGDGVGGLISQSLGVVDPDGAPANGIQVEILSSWGGAYLVPEGAVHILTDYEDSCAGSDTESCNAWFDVEGQRFIEFGGGFEEVADFRPTYMSGVTDNRGQLTFYMFVDSAPLDSDGAATAFTVYVDIGVKNEIVEFSFTE